MILSQNQKNDDFNNRNNFVTDRALCGLGILSSSFRNIYGDFLCADYMVSSKTKQSGISSTLDFSRTGKKLKSIVSPKDHRSPIIIIHHNQHKVQDQVVIDQQQMAQQPPRPKIKITNVVRMARGYVGWIEEREGRRTLSCASAPKRAPPRKSNPPPKPVLKTTSTISTRRNNYIKYYENGQLVRMERMNN